MYDVKELREKRRENGKVLRVKDGVSELIHLIECPRIINEKKKNPKGFRPRYII